MSLQAVPEIPKTIWIMWLQGLDKAPYIVRKCYASWKELNPNWNIVFLDENNVSDYVDLQTILTKSNNMQIQAMADLIRLNLLAKYGGVWVDATCFCRVPLDTWLEKYATSGFFAFSASKPNKVMDTWFLASSIDGYLISRWRDEAVLYWNSSDKLTRYRPGFTSRVLKLLDLSIHTTRFWFSYPVRKVLKAYPYIWPNYLFTELLRKDARFRSIWARTGKFDAEALHKIQRVGMLSPLTEEVKREVDSKEQPLYKLTWKYKASKYNENCTLYYLLEVA